MSCKICECDLALLNTKLPSCTSVHSVAKRVFIQSKYDSAGALNKIPTGTTLDSAYWEAAVNNADELARIYPIEGEFKNVEHLREDSVYQDFNDGSSRFVRKGAKTFTGMLLEFPAAYLKTLDQFKCGDWNVYFVDCNGGLVGYGDSQEFMTGVPTEKNSFDANFMEGTDSEVPMLSFRVQWKSSTTDANIKYISASDIDFDLENLSGLLDVVPLKNDNTYGYNVTSATEFTFSAMSLFGTKVTGLVLADFVLENETSASPIVITSVVESPSGFYTVTIPAQTTNDVLRLNLNKTGFSGDQLARYDIVAL